MSVRTPVVSVMMPAFNAEAYVAQAIEAVQAQSFADWELVVYDDGSTDRTAALVTEFAEADSRIRLIRGQHGGRGRARNAALQHCHGEFVAMCDADDVSFPQRFEKQVAYLCSHPDISAVGAFQIPFAGLKPNGEFQTITWPVNSDEIGARFDALRMGMPNCVAMVRRSCFDRFGGFDEQLLRCQDFGFFLKLHFSGCRFFNLSEPLVYYRQEGVMPSFRYWSENECFHALAIERAASATGQVGRKLSTGVKGKYLHIRYAYFFIKRHLELKRVGN